MIRLFKKKPGSKSSALIGQKPKRRRGKKSDDPSRFPLAAKFAVCLLGVIIVAVTGSKLLTVFESISDGVVRFVQLPVKHWQIHITDTEGSPLSDDLRKEIHRTVLKTLARAPSFSLEEVVSSVEALGALEQVTAVRPRYNALVVSAALRKPVMTVAAGGKTRFVTADGYVYGEAVADEAPGAEPGVKSNPPLLSGVLDAKTSWQFDHSQKLITTTEERRLILDGLGLYRLAAKHGLDLKAVSYQGFRGFGLMLQDGTDVILGQPAFEYKLEKLLSIMGKLKAQGTTASRIELDFDGKAFIKERKL